MMSDLAAIYDASFFADWGRNNEPYISSAEAITEAIIAEFGPRRIADLGCGCGVYTHFFSLRGIDAFALDGVKPPLQYSFPVPIQIQDLTTPFENIWGAFDLGICLEVAEHIPEGLSGAFLDNIIRFSDTILLSAAPPRQGGHHHVNERPKRYWVQRLAERGFAYNRPRTGRIFQAVLDMRPPLPWMVQHLSVYEKVSDARSRRRRLPFSVRVKE